MIIMVKKHLEILTEEPSAEAALRLLLPKIVGASATYKIITHRRTGSMRLLSIFAGVSRQV